jgi:hypothetical protein
MLIPTDEYMPTALGNAHPSLATGHVDELAGVSHGFSISGGRHIWPRGWQVVRRITSNRVHVVNN